MSPEGREQQYIDAIQTYRREMMRHDRADRAHGAAFDQLVHLYRGARREGIELPDEREFVRQSVEFRLWTLQTWFSELAAWLRPFQDGSATDEQMEAVDVWLEDFLFTLRGKLDFLLAEGAKRGHTPVWGR